MPLYNYTGLLIDVHLVINLLVLKTELPKDFPESNTFTIKYTSLFKQCKQRFQRRVLLIAVKLMDSTPYYFQFKVVDNNPLPISLIPLSRRHECSSIIGSLLSHYYTHRSLTVTSSLRCLEHQPRLSFGFAFLALPLEV